MRHSRRWSLGETLASTAIGYLGSVVIAYYLFPRFGWQTSVSQANSVVLVFTIWSIIRGYGVRRASEALHAWWAERNKNA